MKQWFAAALAWTGLAQAHEGHGIAQAVHWHVADAVGLVVAAVAVATVWWLGRK
jgi:hypothetical protein